MDKIVTLVSRCWLKTAVFEAVRRKRIYYIHRLEKLRLIKFETNRVNGKRFGQEIIRLISLTTIQRLVEQSIHIQLPLHRIFLHSSANLIYKSIPVYTLTSTRQQVDKQISKWRSWSVSFITLLLAGKYRWVIYRRFHLSAGILLLLFPVWISCFENNGNSANSGQVRYYWTTE